MQFDANQLFSQAQSPGDQKQVMNIIGNQMHQKDLENLRLKISKEYELKIKDIEKVHYERMQVTRQETKKAFDVTMENMKTIYEDEIKVVKAAKRELEERVNTMKRELVKKEGDIQLLQERIKSQEKEKNLKLEHAQLLCKLSNALKGYAEVIES